MLVSPAEPKMFHDLGTVSLTTERYGADFLMTSKDFGVVGVQRKEINDFVASARDGRLAREAVQLQSCGLGVVVIEGRIAWTDSGLLLANGEWTKLQHHATIWSLNSRGLWTMSSTDAAETHWWLQRFASWLTKGVDNHSSLKQRPSPPKNEWGQRGSREWQLWVLQGFDGVGRKMAEAIVDHFGGLPLRWDVTEEELRGVKGIGKGRAKALVDALRREARDGGE